MRLVRRDPERGYLDSMLWVPKKYLNIEGAKNALTFEIYNDEVVNYLLLYDETDDHLIVPRGTWEPSSFPCKFVDCRPLTYHRTRVVSRVKLDHRPQNGVLVPDGEQVQQRAFDALLAARGGTLQLRCGAGKTVVALHFAAALQVPTIICVDNTHLLAQWQKEIATHLHVPGGVGLIQGQHRTWKKGVVMATYHTLANWALTMPEEIRTWFGLIIWDEGHHVNAPVFSRSAPLFYGYRLSLSATPDRTDGQHVVCTHHVGPIIFKDVKQKLPPKIYFKWTGQELDLEDQNVKLAVHDTNGDLHLGKLAVYFGGWRKRLIETVLPEVDEAYQKGKKILVLSNSVNEVINLMVLWTTGDPNARLYTDIPIPTPAEVGMPDVLVPWELTKEQKEKTTRAINDIWKNIRENGHTLPNSKIEAFKGKAEELQQKLRAHECEKKVQSALGKLQRAFIKDLLAKPSTAGIFTEIVEPDERMRMLKERRVVFAIMKYGKEGLDDSELNHIILCEPVSDKNVIQQIMGRPRDKTDGELVILEDNVGPLINQCKSLRKHFKHWPIDEGGPFRYDLLGHPAVLRRRQEWKKSEPSQRALKAAGL